MEQEQNNALVILLHLLHRARGSQNNAQLGFMMVNETRQLLPYRQAAFWSEGIRRHVACLSGLADPDPTAPYLQWLAKLFEHLSHQLGNQVRSHCCDITSMPDSLASEWSEWLPEHGLWLSLGDAGALFLAREDPWSEYEINLALELADGYRHALSKHAPHRNWRRLAVDWLQGGRYRKAWLMLPLVVCLFPVRMSVLAHAEVVPSEPLLMRAPQSGVIDKVLVLPNQRVKSGDALFLLDETVQAGQYALARQEALAAKENFRVNAQMAVTDDKSKLELSQGKAKLEAKDISADYAGREVGRLHVLAPKDGVVVFSDRNDWQGKAVALGEKVMTLADPDKIELTAWLPAADAIDLSPGSPVTLYPNASPFHTYDATLVRIAYKAEVNESNLLAYRMQAHFDSSQKLPMLGQMGTARVYGNWVPLGYYVLRRPLTAARQWLGW
jgi:hypothetical protein